MGLRKRRFTGSTSEEYARYQYAQQKHTYGVVKHRNLAGRETPLSEGGGYVVRQLFDGKFASPYRDQKPKDNRSFDSQKRAQNFADKLNKR